MCVQVMKTANRFEISSLLEKILLKQVRWCLTFVGLHSLSELFKYGKLLHKICISFTKRHLSLMYKGHSNRKCNSSSILSRLQNKHLLYSRSSFFLHSHLHLYIFHICQSLFVRNEH
jgi:hypothetical protein